MNKFDQLNKKYGYENSPQQFALGENKPNNFQQKFNTSQTPSYIPARNTQFILPQKIFTRQSQIQNQNYGQGKLILPPTHSIFKQHKSIQPVGTYIQSSIQYPQNINIVQQPVISREVRESRPIQKYQQFAIKQSAMQRETRPKEKYQQIETMKLYSQNQNASCSPCSPCLAGCCICCPKTCQICCKPEGSCGCCTKCCQPGQLCYCCRVCYQPNHLCECCQTCCLPKGICGCCTNCCMPGGACQCCQTCSKDDGICSCCQQCWKPGCEGLNCCPENSCCRNYCKICCCPWWVILLIGLLLLAGILIGILVGLNKINIIYKNNNQINNTNTTSSKSTSTNNINNATNSTSNTSQTCQPGFFQSNGQCIKCPQNSSWNGTNCVSSLNQ